MKSPRAASAGALTALLIAAVGVFFFPGIAMYDTVAQYGQVVSGDVDDWHPPIMVRLWQLLQPLGGGTAPMFVLQLLLYASGFGLMVGALVRAGRPRSAMLTALLGLSPLLLGWQMVVLKDAQMLGALLAAVAIVSHYRLASRRIPLAPAIIAALLIAYATLVRANALFATIPLAVLLVPRPRSAPAKAALAIVAIIVILAISPFINNRLLGAAPSGVAKSQPLFDLAAIAAATPNSVEPFTADERAQIIARHCVKPFFWDPVTDPSSCGPVTARAKALGQSELYLDLAHAALSHPLAYGFHRLAHWNSTERWLVPPGRIGAQPPDEAEPNSEGLNTPPSDVVPAWQNIAAFETQTPLGWPIVWTLISVLLLPLAWARRASPHGSLALGLLVSSVVLEASFLGISIASDLRYHLWSMTASALALILLAGELKSWPRFRVASAAMLVLIIIGGVTTRLSLPRAPGSYEAMLHAPSG